MSSSCSDVCEIVTDWLLQLGFPIDTQDENHDDIIEALGKVKLVKESE